MSTPNTTESPIVNSPIINSPIVNSPIISGPIVTEGEPEIQDFNPCCAAGMPAGNRVFYFKFVLAVFLVFGGGVYALYKLCEYLGVFNQ